MKALIDEAKQYIQRPIQDKRDAFLRLCSLNLLNAAIKKKEFKDSLSYGYIKPFVSRFVEYVITHTDNSYVDEMYYNSEQKCMYIRCYGVQFSFHNIIITESISAFVDSKSNIPVQWDGVRLQPIAQDLFLLAKDLHSGNIEENQINEFFNHIIESK